MSQVFASTDTKAAPSFPERHPFLLIAIGLVLVFVVLAFIYKKNQSTPPTTPPVGQPTTGDTSGLSLDANGNPILYVPTDKFLNETTSDIEKTTTNKDSNNTTYPAPPSPVPHPPFDYDGGPLVPGQPLPPAPPPGVIMPLMTGGGIV